MPTGHRLFAPDYAVPPGETVREIMEIIEMSPAGLGAYLELTADEVDALLAGRLPITLPLATQLATLTSVATSFWLNLEANYRATLARLEATPQ
jgi:HTH-type transcriptional regulator/antitoxin HigA